MTPRSLYGLKYSGVERKSTPQSNDPTVQKWSVVLAQMVAVPENEVSVTQHHRGSPEDGLIESSGTL